MIGPDQHFGDEQNSVSQAKVIAEKTGGGDEEAEAEGKSGEGRQGLGSGKAAGGGGAGGEKRGGKREFRSSQASSSWETIRAEAEADARLMASKNARPMADSGVGREEGGRGRGRVEILED